jgi:hypothetical protein
VIFNNAAMSVWEEGLASARDAGGFAAASRWELQFKRDVFARIIQTLNRIGWTVGESTHIFTGNNARHCRKGDLQADLRLSGRCIELKFFQNVNAPERPDHDGRYQSDQERHMPYLVRIEMERTRRRIRDYLCNVFTGYVFEPDRFKRDTGATAVDLIEQSYRESSHFKGDLTRYTISDYNNQSADNGRIEHGARVWFADRKGRIVTGTAYYNINNMWWVAMGRHGLSNVASFEIYVKRPENPRVKRNGKLRRTRLEKELGLAVAAMRFERAALLRDIIFPGETELFNVWSVSHQLFHRPDFCGYTSDQSKAGKFTASEARGWSNADNRVVPISATTQEAQAA